MAPDSKMAIDSLPLIGSWSTIAGILLLGDIFKKLWFELITLADIYRE